jgi:ubiquinone/menaquinone biosynthesis C-methylase UbiE
LGNIIQKSNIESLPWYNENLDYDLENELDHRKITKGRFLYFGTGPATQAVLLAKRVFNITATDLSESAINRARTMYTNETDVNFIVDDILNSKLKENEFTIFLIEAVFMFSHQ